MLIQHNNNFNLLRLLGALLVIISHCYYVTGKNNIEPVSLITGGKLETSAFGLCIFFFISGYFVCKSAFESENGFYFVRKRIARIYPALILVVLLTVFLIGPLFTQLRFKDYFSDGDTWKYLYTLTGFRIRTGLPGVFTEPGSFMPGVNGSLWTISLELMLYTTLTFFLLSGVIKNKKMFSAISLSLLLICILTVSVFTSLDFFYVKYFYLSGIFFLGSFVYSSSPSKKTVKIILLSIILLYAVLYIANPTFIRFDFLLLILIALAAYLAGFYKGFVINLNNDISYGLYILAYPIQQIIFRMTGYNQSIATQLLLTLIVAIPLAFLSWRLIEKPAINFNRRNMNTQKPGKSR